MSWSLWTRDIIAGHVGPWRPEDAEATFRDELDDFAACMADARPNASYLVLPRGMVPAERWEKIEESDRSTSVGPAFARHTLRPAMTHEEIYAIAPDEPGWRRMPNGNRVRLGPNCEIHATVQLGDRVEIGPGCRLAARCSLAEVQPGSYPLQILGPEYTVYPSGPGLLGIGCHVHTWAKWQDQWEHIASVEKVSKSDVAIYRRYAEIVWEWMQEHMPETADVATDRAD